MKRKLIVLFTSSLSLAIMPVVACISHATTSVVRTGEIHVRETDTGNHPLGGGKVVSDIQPDGQLKLEGLTDNNGNVVFQDVKSGDYEFYFSWYNYTETYITITVKLMQTDLTPL